MRNTGTSRFSCSASIWATTSICSSIPDPRSLVASSSSTWNRPAELFISISIRTARSSPGSILTSSIAAADSEWMLGRRVSNGMRERPLAMSSASATRTMPDSIVIGSPRLRWPITACRASEITTVSSGSS